MTLHRRAMGDRAIAFLAKKRVPLGFVTTIVALILARPTWTTWRAGLLVAVVGEAIRVWAAGHLEKGREVTSSGPYRWTGHPLYVGSSILALGVVIAAWSVPLAVVAAIYMGTTITAAIRTEEAFLRRTFGDAYDVYQRSRGVGGEAQRAEVNERSSRRFSLARVMRNREYRAVAGLVVGFALLALKVVVPI
jgi:protein-S-isoprenylcysteine O-methyltransferase Ste14